MEWLLVVWFVVSSGNTSVLTQPTTARMNSRTACETVISQGYNQGLRGVCTHDPVQR